jgi:peroxiredoxin
MKDLVKVIRERLVNVIFNFQKGTATLLLLVAVFSVTGCSNDDFRISGTISGVVSKEYLLFREIKPGFLEPVDSVMPGQDGKFSFRSATEWPAFYMLSIGGDDFLTLLVSPGDKIEVKAARGSLASPEALSGSEGTSVMLGFSAEHRRVIDELQRLTNVYDDSIMSPQLPILMDSLDSRAAGIVDSFRETALKLLADNGSSMVSVYLLNQQVVPGLQLFDPAKDPELFYRADSALYALYPGSDLVLDLHSFVAGLRNSSAVGTGTFTGTIPGVGTMMPEIALPDPGGDTLKLSSLRGRVVLVDFWAAWCPPCREENPNLVKLYDIYHWKGFDIFQVSLDLRQEEWTEAIRKDRLDRWKHVSDLRYRDSEVVKRFGLTQIPASFLIDREGRVVAVNLRGDDLGKKLGELMGGQ